MSECLSKIGIAGLYPMHIFNFPRFCQIAFQSYRLTNSCSNCCAHSHVSTWWDESPFWIIVWDECHLLKCAFLCSVTRLRFIYVLWPLRFITLSSFILFVFLWVCLHLFLPFGGSYSGSCFFIIYMCCKYILPISSYLSLFYCVWIFNIIP